MTKLKLWNEEHPLYEIITGIKTREDLSALCADQEKYDRVLRELSYEMRDTRDLIDMIKLSEAHLKGNAKLKAYLDKREW